MSGCVSDSEMKVIQLEGVPLQPIADIGMRGETLA